MSKFKQYQRLFWKCIFIVPILIANYVEWLTNPSDSLSRMDGNNE